MLASLIILLVSLAVPTPEAPVTHVSGDDSLEYRVWTNNKGETLYAVGGVSTEAKLPEDYPRPTAPGNIELKYYPSVRRAEVSGDSSTQNASRSGFMPLFRHISSRNIAMTAPVEMDYEDDGWTMSFLYETQEDGPIEDDGRVRVIDTEPVIVLSMGVQGSSDGTDIRDRSDELIEWIEASDEWDQAGPVRTMGYNGPYIPVQRRWWEVQVPVRTKTAQAESGDSAKSGEGDRAGAWGEGEI